MRGFVLIIIALLAVAGCTSASRQHDASTDLTANASELRPTVFALDAHDGHVIQDTDQYVLYGTSYGCGFKLLDASSPWCGVRAYTSDDLVAWQDRGLLFDPQPWQARCAEGSFGCFRPHVASRSDGTWVMWLNVADDVPRGYAVLTAPTSLGPWSEVQAPQLAVNLTPTRAWGDHDIQVDADGVGWLAYTVIDAAADNLHDIVIEKLDPTMTTGTGEFMRLGVELAEAPGLFERNGTWYVTYSDPACPYCGGTGTSYAMAPNPLGPWTLMGRISDDSCDGQPAAVNDLELDGEAAWLFQSDQWQQIDGTFNPNQTAATTYLAPIKFSAKDQIDPLVCVDSW